MKQVARKLSLSYLWLLLWIARGQDASQAWQGSWER